MDILAVTFLFIFVIISFIYSLLNTKTDNSKIGILIEKNKKHSNVFGYLRIIFFFITILTLIFF